MVARLGSGWFHRIVLRVMRAVSSCSYIFTTEDGAFPYAAQQGMAQQFGPHAKSATLKSGHSPFLSMPGELVKAIESVL